MNSKIWMHRVLSMCLIVTVYAAYSMVALAAADKIAGEISVLGSTGETAVTVNGEAVQNGRTVFSTSTITTPETASAIININNVGKIQIAPNSTVTVSFTENGISGDLLTGQVTALSAAKTISVKTVDGKTVELSAGESVATGTAQDTNNKSGNGGSMAVWLLVFGGALGAAVYAATRDNDIQLGGGTTVISPTR